MIKLATNLQNLLIKQSKDGTCWKGYKQVGKKMKGGKQVPDCVPVTKQAENSPTNPELWAQAKSKARAKFDVYPSAYANGWAAKWYKDQGGGWKKTKAKSEESSKQSNLDRWFKEDWVDISKKDESGKHPPCGRSDADSKAGYPKCRPSKRVSEETPETTRSMSKEEKAKAVAQKRRAEAKPREGKKPHMTSHGEKKADFVHPNDPWANAARFGILGGAAGGLLGGGLPEKLEKPRLGITTGEWNSGGSAAGSLLGFLLGGAGGYMATPESDEKDSPKKKKTEKKAYGVEDDYFYTDRYLDGGDIWGMSKQDAINYTKMLSDAAKKRNLIMSFSPGRNPEENSMTPEEAIKALNAAKDEDLQSWNNEGLPYFKMVQVADATNDKIDYSDLPENEVLQALQKKTKKKANTLASESMVDVPIRCTPGFGCKRYMTPQETAEVAAAKQQLFPDYLATDADPISSQLSSPNWSAAGHGLLGALLGAGVGAGSGKLLDYNVPVSALIGGALGGLGGGLYGYGSRTRENKQIEDLIEDLPVGADIGDIEVFSDPGLKQQLARDFQRQLVRRSLMNENERSY